MTPAAKRILIVDDDRDFVEATQAFLEANGFTVLRAHNGRDGVKLARMERPDLILMDIMMVVLTIQEPTNEVTSPPTPRTTR